MKRGYWQVSLTPMASPKTAFSNVSGHWQYRVLPFGLHGTPATYQRLMYTVLRLHHQLAAEYLNDVVIHSATWVDHTHHLAVLSELRVVGLTAIQKEMPPVAHRGTAHGLQNQQRIVTAPRIKGGCHQDLPAAHHKKKNRYVPSSD